MKTIIFCAICLLVGAHLLLTWRRKPIPPTRCIDAIVPAYNEEGCLEQTLCRLYANPYINRIICVNDGSTDGTSAELHRLARPHPRMIVVDQANTGKGGALMHGLEHTTAEYVFLTDADTLLPPNGGGLGFMLGEMERGADAVGGLPSTNLKGAGFLPHLRASAKVPMIIIQRMFQQMLGGAPFIISGACGLFRTEVLKAVPFSDRTKVEDLDLSWSLIAHGYKVRLAPRCVVYSQDCNDLVDEWRRWRRWIVGYAVCMRLHKGLLLTRFGLFSILPMFLIVALGVGSYSYYWTRAVAANGWTTLPSVLFPLLWLGIIMLVGTVSALHHNRLRLIPMAPLSLFYVLLAYTIWVVHGLKGLITGREPQRDKPTRYAHVVA